MSDGVTDKPFGMELPFVIADDSSEAKTLVLPDRFCKGPWEDGDLYVIRQLGEHDFRLVRLVPEATS